MTTRVLIIEPDSDVASAAERHLAELGYHTVGSFEQVDQAHAIAERLRPDVVLLGLDPDDHAAVLDAAVAVRERLSIPVVLRLERVTAELVDRALRADVCGFVLGPSSPSELRASIETGLRRARVERRLRECEARCQALVESTLDALVTADSAAESLQRLQSAALRAVASAVFITDRRHEILWVNPAFEELTGYTHADAFGRRPPDLLAIDGQDAPRADEVEAVLDTYGAWSGESQARRKDGSRFACEVVITPARDASGAVTHFVSACRDVTEQRRLQQQFLQAQKMEVVGRLAGGIAHDFNNLLTVINGTSELALLEMPDEDPRRSDLQEIRDAAERARRLTRQLLAFSHKQRATRAVLSVSGQVRALAGMIRRLIGEDVRLEIIDPPEGHNDRVLCDEGQLEQVLLNLAVNARDAMPGGGSLTIETREVELDLDFAARHSGVNPGSHVMLVVSDTGIGMSDEVKERLFEPFFTTKGQGKGTGLGLATVHRIVSQYGGCVSVQSASGQGAVFKVMLPTVTGERDRTSRPPELLVRGTETILFVEDERGLRELSSRMLRSMGYDVIAVPDGDAALSAVSTYHGPVHLLFTDVVLPGMSGPALATRLLSMRSTMRVLFASGYAEDVKLFGEVIDARLFLAKPFSIAELTRKVRQVLDGPPLVVPDFTG